MNQGQNLYHPEDLTDDLLPSGPKIFISHRSKDKPTARAVASLLSALDIHYWLDEEDQDLQRATALGLAGDQAVVHAIERGVKHATFLMGLLSARTKDSWWVPYEIGYAQAIEKSAAYFLSTDLEEQGSLPSYARLTPGYRSIDELVRWAESQKGLHLHSDLGHLPDSLFEALVTYAPLDPTPPDFATLCERAMRAIEVLADPAIQALLTVSSQDFDWLPTRGGYLRDIAYDLFAPYSYLQLNLPLDYELATDTNTLYRLPSLHYEIAQFDPPLAYNPSLSNWKSQRYLNPKQIWLQGLEMTQLRERTTRFLSAKNRKGMLRFATKEEFKAEFNRALGSVDKQLRRSLGVYVNPLFGFTPLDRPVFWRMLAVKYLLYARMLGRNTPNSPFDANLQNVAEKFLSRLAT